MAEPKKKSKQRTRTPWEEELHQHNKEIHKEEKHLPALIVIPLSFRVITESDTQAAFLSRVFYWHNLMGREFYKSINEWCVELGLSEKTIRRTYKELFNLGYIEYEKKYQNKKSKFWFSYNRKEVNKAVEYYKLHRKNPANDSDFIAKTRWSKRPHASRPSGQNDRNNIQGSTRDQGSTSFSETEEKELP